LLPRFGWELTKTSLRHVASSGEILTGRVDRLAKKSIYFAARKKRKLDDKSLRLYMRIALSFGCRTACLVRLVRPRWPPGVLVLWPWRAHRPAGAKVAQKIPKYFANGNSLAAALRLMVLRAGGLRKFASYYDSLVQSDVTALRHCATSSACDRRSLA